MYRVFQGKHINKMGEKIIRASWIKKILEIRLK
jgi:hypothetical protein